MSYMDNIRQITPYVPGEQPKVAGDLIKLNTNENPYPPSPKVKAAIEALPVEEMRLYPDTTAAPLVNALAAYHGLEPSQIFVGVGSDDVLANCFLTYFAGKKPVLFPDITYSFYDVWAELYRIPYETVPVGDDFRIRQEDYLRENGGIVIANPNAPTSIGEPLSFIEKIVAGNPDSVVIVDEAYVDFGGETAIPLLKKYKNLVITRTFSKSRSFAGMRIGYAMADGKLIEALNNVKFSINSYTMNCAAIAYGVATVEDEPYFREMIAKITETREKTAETLTSLGFTCLPSQTNFLFVTHGCVPAEEIFTYLKTQNIYVRFFKKPRIDNYLRITIGTGEQMERLTSVLSQYLQTRQ
ncbi:MAG: histidinol-phosphate transaminase [Lachnospiraceae bacterium]|nr:histidinol-phosphate transaminase [Lachnospiraceae bacterium]